ncbi:hypothetical protein E4U45_000687 [Claviceps purpurea]|nr:hypothetical protein E4U45_000687 [Claviceps purpurea]
MRFQPSVTLLPIEALHGRPHFFALSLAWIWRIWLPRHHRRPLLDCRCCLPNFIPPTINSLSCPLHARPPPNNPRSHRQRSKQNTQFNTQARQLASRFIIPR